MQSLEQRNFCSQAELIDALRWGDKTAFEQAEVQTGDINADGLLNQDDYKIFFQNFREINLKVHIDYYAGAEVFSDAWNLWDYYETKYQSIDQPAPVDQLLNDLGFDVFSLRGEDTRTPDAQAFSFNDGDVNHDGVFDSSDLVQLGQTGSIPDVDTDELIRIFAMGTYQ